MATFVVQYRGVEQLVARRAHNPEAGGSSPSPATKMPQLLSSQRVAALIAKRVRQICGNEVMMHEIVGTYDYFALDL